MSKTMYTVVLKKPQFDTIFTEQIDVAMHLKGFHSIRPT